jgi:hypothetical protein
MNVYEIVATIILLVVVVFPIIYSTVINWNDNSDN